MAKMKDFIVYASPETSEPVNKCVIIDALNSSTVIGARQYFSKMLESYRAKYPGHTYRLCETKALAS